MPVSVDEICQWIEENAPEKHDLLVPVSGGTDSALVLWLCQKAVPGRVTGVYVGGAVREEAWFTAIAPIRKIAIDYDGRNPEVLRWAHFLELSLAIDSVLVGTRNRTEDTLGTFSLASRVATFLPIVGLWKSEVMGMCERIGVPAAVLESSRQADPECGRPQKLAALSFKQIDTFLQQKVTGRSGSRLALNDDELAYLESLYIQNLFKQTLPVRGPVSA